MTAYRFYVTDALKIIGGLNMRYADIVKPEPEETRTGEEIIEDITAKLRRKPSKKTKKKG